MGGLILGQPVSARTRAKQKRQVVFKHEAEAEEVEDLKAIFGVRPIAPHRHKSLRAKVLPTPSAPLLPDHCYEYTFVLNPATNTTEVSRELIKSGPQQMPYFVSRVQHRHARGRWKEQASSGGGAALEDIEP
jgi:hypothetical protein